MSTEKPTSQKTNRSMPKKPKAKYRIKNWKSYNQALVQRGSLTLWLNQKALKQWRAAKTPGKNGHPYFYSDLVIQLMMVLQEVFHLPLRQTQGFVKSLLRLMHLRRPVPSYSTLSRRRPSLTIELPHRHTGTAVHVVVDATGLKVYGEGEWKVKQHGVSKHRTWRKLHIGVDAATGELLAVELTDKAISDHDMLPTLVTQTLAKEPIQQLSADGGYDYFACYRTLHKQAPKAQVTIPPRRNAAVSTQPSQHQRNANLRRLRRIGRKAWKRESGYHRRSLAETAIFRFKTIFGPGVSARSLPSQRNQVRVRAQTLNRMTALGLPEAYRV
jgi:hypothetical protein